MRTFLHLTIILLSFAYSTIAQEAATISLKQQKVSFHPQHFHITSVVDSRADTSNIGTMRKGLANRTTIINLEKGAQQAITTYINNNIEQNDNTLPVSLHISELEIYEESTGGKQQVNLNMGLVYYIGNHQLIEYTGSAYIQTGADASTYIDRIIRSNLVSNLKEFDRWAAKNKDNIQTSPTVSAQVNFATKSTDPNLIIYGQRALRLDDFAGAPDQLSIGAAATFSGINASYSIKQLGMSTTITATITTYFHKQKSWVKNEGYNTRVLAHEQLHFDITALKACQLAERIKNYNFSPEHYSEELSELLKTIDYEASQLQKQYDKETQHGTLLNEQEKWQKDIATKLAHQNCR